MTSNRRRFIQGVGAAVTAGLAGCSSNGGSDGGSGDGGSDGGSGDGGSDGGSGDGSSGETTGSAGNETLEFHFVASTPATTTQEALTGAVEAWGEQLDGYDVEPTMEFVGVTAASPTLNQYLGTGNPPHLVMGNAELAQFYKSVEDTTQFLEENFNLPSRAYGGPVGGKSTVIPDHFVVQARWYRKDLYEQAGIEPAETWSQQVSNAEALADTIPDGMEPELIQANPSNTTTYLQNHQWFHTLGVDYIERTGDAMDAVRVSLSDDEQRSQCIDILNHLNTMYQHSPESVNYGFIDMISTYLEDQVAVTNYPGRILDNATDQAPDKLDVTGVAKFPMPEGFDGTYMAGHNPQMLTVPQTEHSDLAFDFLEFYFGSDYYFDRMLGAGPNSTPVTQELLNDDRLQSHETWDNPAGQEYTELLNEYWDNDNYYIAQYGRTEPASVYWSTLINGSNLIGPEMHANASTGRTSSEEAVDRAIERLNNDLPGVAAEYVE